MILHRTKLRTVFMALIGAVAVQACDSSNNAATSPPPPPAPPAATATFEVTTINTTNAQPLSPVAVIAHADGYSLFTVGMPATSGLEILAEGGDNGALIADAAVNAAVVTTASGAAPIPPAGSETLTITVAETDLPGLRLSHSTMLVNTNDAFSGVNGLMIGGLAVGESTTANSIAYDAGTEANSELATEIPGPVGGGEGFNAARNDRADQVSMHAGVVSRDDGFATSDLTNQHRFDNPVVRVRITRTD